MFSVPVQFFLQLRCKTFAVIAVTHIAVHLGPSILWIHNFIDVYSDEITYITVKSLTHL